MYLKSNVFFSREDLTEKGGPKLFSQLQVLPDLLVQIL